MPSTSNNASLWDSGERLGLAALAGQHVADLCVVGLGGSGLTCALEAASLGADVIGIDAGYIGGSAAGRNGGFLLAGLAPFYHDAIAKFGQQRARAMYSATCSEMDRMSAMMPDIITRNGSVRLAGSDDELRDCALHLSALRSDGFAASAYNEKDGRGIFIDDDGAFDPHARCNRLASTALSTGARLFESSRAINIGNGAVGTELGEVRARKIVVAIDGSLDRVLPELNSEVRTARLQMLATAPAPEVSLSYPVYARWGYDYWQQASDGSIAIGGARDIGGDAEWTHATETTAVVQQALEHILREKLGVSAEVTHRWGASVAYTADGLPVVREVRPGVWAVGAYSGTGNVLGSLLGRGLACALIAGDTELLAPFKT